MNINKPSVVKRIIAGVDGKPCDNEQTVKLNLIQC